MKEAELTLTNLCLCQSAAVTWTARSLLTVRTLASVSVGKEPVGGAVTNACLDTPGEGVWPYAQVHMV